MRKFNYKNQNNMKNSNQKSQEENPHKSENMNKETSTNLTPAERLRALESAHSAYLEQVKQEEQEYNDARNKLISEEREFRRKQEYDWRNNLIDEIWKWNNVGERVNAELIVERAWDEKHSYGYNEVRDYAEDLADFVSQIVKNVENEEKCN